MSGSLMLHSNPFFFIFFLLISLAAAAQHNVGDKAGWRLPSVAKLNYTQWASRYTFHVEDTLHFRYDRSSDNVLQVKLADYNSCSNSTPIHAYNDGDTVVYLLRGGDYWFISGTPQHCNTGQKLFIRVLPHEAPSHRSESVQTPAPEQLFSFRGAATNLPVPANPAAAASAPHSTGTPVIAALVVLLAGLLVV